jgi:hypothetical protein
MGVNGIFRHTGRGEEGGLVRRILGLAMFALLLTVMPLSVQAADGVRIDLAEEDGYGRAIFTFPDGVPGYRASINSGILVLDFDKTFDLEPDAFLRQMPRYVALVRQSEDRRSLRLALTTEFTLDTKTAENALYVDLMPPGWTGNPPPLPQEVRARIEAAQEARQKEEDAKLAAKAQGIVEPEAPQPGLSVRVAERAGMTRLVFDWNQPVLYSLVQRQGLATITFDRTAAADLSALRVDPPAYLSSATAIEHEGRLAVVLTLKPGVTISDFREDLNVVLDLKPSSAAAMSELEDAAEDDAGGDQVKTVAGAPKSLLPDAAHGEEDAEDHEGETPEAVPAREEDAPIAANPLPQGKRPEGKAVVRFVAGRSGTDIVVDWPEPVGAAVFERADRLWAVFDRVLPLDISDVTAQELGPFGAPEAVSFDGGTALVVPLREKVLIGAVEDGASWRISAGETIPTTGRPIGISRNWREDGRGSVVFDFRAPSMVLRVRDPLVGDEIIVATARGPGQSLQTPRSFVEFQALQTAHGLAIVPVADDLNVAAAPDNVLVSRRDGLTLSADDHEDAVKVMGEALAAMPAPAEMHFAEWRMAPGETFTERRQHHLAKLANAQMQELGELRFEYGRFLLAYGLAPEARAAFDAAKEARAKYSIEPAYLAVRGVASVLSGRHVDAINDLSGPGLDNAPHAAAWRGLARAELGHWEAARAQFSLAGAIVDAFGEDLRTDFRAMAAIAALKGGDAGSAEHYASGFPADPQSQKAKAQILLVNAMIADARGNADAAAGRYDMAIANGYPPVAARARLGKALMLHKAGELDTEALARELESLRYAWRGDALELDVLTQLAALRLEQGKTGDALKLMRTATDNFPDSDEAHKMNMRMSDIFADYFLSEAAQEMQPVQALAFFESFKELTPIGQRGDELIRNLAERLVEVDLLSQAAHLLDYQVANRLHGGVAKAQVAARLASIFLSDQQPARALAALRATKQNLLPEALAERRMLLETRALADLKQYDNALELMDGKKGKLIERLRADVLWDAGRWPEAGAAIEAVLGDTWKIDEPLSTEARLLAMRGAIAYSLAGDETGLASLRAKYGQAMSESADASAFAVVSEPIVKQGVAFREMASRIASVDTLDRFLASLKVDEAVAVN